MLYFTVKSRFEDVNILFFGNRMTQKERFNEATSRNANTTFFETILSLT